MAQHTATVTWTREAGAAFTDDRYSRRHSWRFDGGATVVGSSSPHVVPVPYSDAAAVDPEEAFLASLSSCHMLWFLAIAAKRGFVVDTYDDHATATLAAGPAGKLMVTQAVLAPHCVFSGVRVPTAEELEALHHRAHEECFIARSVTTEILCRPTMERATATA